MALRGGVAVVRKSLSGPSPAAEEGRGCPSFGMLDEKLPKKLLMM